MSAKPAPVVGRIVDLGTRRPSLTFWDKMDALHVEAGIVPVPQGVGFTVTEYADHYGLKRISAQKRVEEMVAHRKAKKIGKRGRNIVYDLV